MNNKIKTKSAFTLAEVLITLVIIGVVAALIIPTAVSKYREQQTIQSLKTTYSSFAQAIKLAESNNGPIETWDIGSQDTFEGALKMYNLLSPHLSLIKECGRNSGCFADNYTTLHGTVSNLQPNTHHVYAKAILNNGVSFAVWSNGSCKNEFSSMGDTACGVLRVDVNGSAKPNRYGYDSFMFYITSKGLIPAGINNYQLNNSCKSTNTNRENGSSCTAWVLYKNNFDYKTRDVSW